MHVDYDGLQEDLETYDDFLVDPQIENGRHKVFNFANNFLSMQILITKLYLLFHSLKRAANLKVVFDFFSKNMEDGSCRYYYPHGRKHTDWTVQSRGYKRDLKKPRNCSEKLMWLNPTQKTGQTQSRSFTTYQ